MFTTKFMLMVLYLILNELIYAKKLEEIFTCMNETECDELIEKDILEETSNTTAENIYNTTNNIISSSIYPTQTPQIQIIPTTEMPHKIQFNNEFRNQSVYKMQSDTCECDLTVNFCFLIPYTILD